LRTPIIWTYKGGVKKQKMRARRDSSQSASNRRKKGRNKFRYSAQKSQGDCAFKRALKTTRASGEESEETMRMALGESLDQRRKERGRRGKRNRWEDANVKNQRGGDKKDMHPERHCTGGLRSEAKTTSEDLRESAEEQRFYKPVLQIGLFGGREFVTKRYDSDPPKKLGFSVKTSLQVRDHPSNNL